MVDALAPKVCPTATGPQVKLRDGTSVIEVKVASTVPVLVTTAETST